MPECYKCGTQDDLSLKKSQRGKMTFVCRPCRRNAMNAWNRDRRGERRNYVDIQKDQWIRWSHDSCRRILANHR